MEEIFEIIDVTPEYEFTIEDNYTQSLPTATAAEVEAEIQKYF